MHRAASQLFLACGESQAGRLIRATARRYREPVVPSGDSYSPDA